MITFFDLTESMNLHANNLPLKGQLRSMLGLQEALDQRDA